MRKAIKLCLALAMAAAMTVPAYADAVYTVTGHAEGTFVQKSVKDEDGALTMGDTAYAEAVSTQDMNADGELGAKVVNKGDVWTATGFIEFDTADATVKSPRDTWAKVENDTFSVLFGRTYLGGIQLGGAYFGPGNYNQWVGEQLSSREAVVKFGLTEVGLTVWYGMNEVAGDYDASSGLGSSQYNRTFLGAVFNKSFGDIDLAVQYASYADAINKDNYGQEKGTADGRTATETAVAVQYNMDTMHFSLGYDAWTTTDGGDDVDALSNTIMDLYFDMDMEGFMSGLSVNYFTKSLGYVNGTDKETVDTTGYSASITIPVGAASVFVEYGSQSAIASQSGATAGNDSTLAVRMKYGF